MSAIPLRGHDLAIPETDISVKVSRYVVGSISKTEAITAIQRLVNTDFNPDQWSMYDADVLLKAGEKIKSAIESTKPVTKRRLETDLTAHGIKYT